MINARNQNGDGLQDSIEQLVAPDGTRRGDKIPGSIYLRDFCAGCLNRKTRPAVTPIRVEKVLPNSPAYCRDCEGDYELPFESMLSAPRLQEHLAHWKSVGLRDSAREVLSLYHDIPPKTMEEIAKLRGTTRHNIQQIIQRAYDKLQKAGLPIPPAPQYFTPNPDKIQQLSCVPYEGVIPEFDKPPAKRRRRDRASG